MAADSRPHALLARLITAALAVGLVLGACAPSVPAPTAAPARLAESKPAVEPAKPVESKPAAPAAAPAASPPSASGGPAASPAASPAAKPADAAKPAPAASGPTRELRFGLVSNILYSAIYLGVEKGLFVKHGLDLKLRQFNSGAEVTKALQAGEVDLGVAAIQTYIAAKNQDIPFKGFFLLVSDPFVAGVDQNLSLMAHPDAGITKIQDLAGKKIGAPAGTSGDQYLREVLKKENVPVENVAIVNVTIPVTHTALISKNVDAVSIQEPYGELLLSQLPSTRVLIRGGGFVSQRIMVTAMNDWLAKNPDLAEKFGVAYAEAAQYARKNLDEAGDAATRQLSGISSEVARKAVRHPPFDPRNSKLVEQSWQSENEVLLSQKKIRQAIPYADGYDGTIVDKVVKEYPQFFNDLKPLQ